MDVDFMKKRILEMLENVSHERLEFIMAMEEEFDIGEIDEDDLAGLKTVGDCVRYLYNKTND